MHLPLSVRNMNGDKMGRKKDQTMNQTIRRIIELSIESMESKLERDDSDIEYNNANPSVDERRQPMSILLRHRIENELKGERDKLNDFIRKHPDAEDNIKAIIFDFGGVIAGVIRNDDLGDIRDIMEILKMCDIDCDEAAIRVAIREGLEQYTAFRNRTDTDLPAAEIIKMMFPDQKYNAKLERESRKLLELIDVKRDSISIRPEAHTVLKELKARGYILALISNTITGRVKEEMQKHGISVLMSTEVYSHEELVRKPNKKIFKIALNKLGLDPRECVFIGDTLDKDVEGAVNAGFSKAILFDYGGATRNGKNYIAINNFEILLDMYKDKNAVRRKNKNR